MQLEEKKSPEIEIIAKKLTSVKQKFESLSEQEICDGKGTPLMTEMKEIMFQLKPISQENPMVCIQIKTKKKKKTSRIKSRKAHFLV